jgi:desulfoferrodoxin-like iron-binding protein
MSDFGSTQPPEYDLEQWTQALTIHVGSAYACKTCGQLVMVTRGGVGTLELICCGQPMQKVAPAAGGLQ